MAADAVVGANSRLPSLNATRSSRTACAPARSATPPPGCRSLTATSWRHRRPAGLRGSRALASARRDDAHSASSTTHRQRRNGGQRVTRLLIPAAARRAAPVVVEQRDRFPRAAVRARGRSRRAAAASPPRRHRRRCRTPSACRCDRSAASPASSVSGRGCLGAK